MRATPKRFIRTLFIVSVSGFFIINMNLFIRSGIDDPEGLGGVGYPADQGMHLNIEQLPGRMPLLTNRTSPKPDSADAHLNIPPFQVPVSNISKDSETGVSGNKSTSQETHQRDPSLWAQKHEYNGTLDVPGIKEYIRRANKEQKIFNLDRFDLSSSQNTVVIVVQVHNRPDYLRHLIDSLRKARFIEQSLVVFSHDFFSERLNNLVKQIDFCPVMQIFYPHSIQLHPKEFPGEDPKDCARDLNREQAMAQGCNNAAHPDKYGHYREAFITQTKHHWFWKVNHVFDALEVTRNFNGPVLFLEEDHYVVEDFIPVLMKMYRFKEQSCKECNIFTLGNYDKKPTYGPLASKVEIVNWISSKHNMGMSMNREVWQKIKACAQQFCSFDDYNWDWSLQYISQSCIPDKLKCMVMKSPRTYHIGECGMHNKGKNCNPMERVHFIENLLSVNQQYMFPDTLSVHGYPRVPNRMPKPNGGWGDTRDHELCLSFTKSEMHR